MTTSTNAPFTSEYVVRRLLDPAAVEGEPHGATLAEWRSAFGHDGEHAAETWSRHGAWLRAAARQRQIQPMYNGRLYVEAVALGERKGD